MRYLGNTAKLIRERLGLTQVEMAKKLSITSVQLSKIENNKAMPSPKVIALYENISGINPYVLDWCSDPDLKSIPLEVRNAANALSKLWSKD